MPVLHLDWETRSVLDLRTVGLHRYARDPGTDIWCAQWALGDGDVRLWLPGQPAPIEVIEHVRSGGEVAAHGYEFEHEVCNEIAAKRYGWPLLDPDRAICTMSTALAMGFPAGLEDCARALRLVEQKDTEGHALMMRMARPRSKPGVAPVVWWDEPAKLERLYAYCRQDVVVERELHRRLRPLSPAERRAWSVHFAINRRGAPVDIGSVRAAARVCADVVQQCNVEMHEVTAGAVPAVTNVGKLTAWLKAQGVKLETLAKRDVIDLLAAPAELPPAAVRALQLRQEAGRASTAKFSAIDAAAVDGRLFGMYVYHKAATGRFASRGAQVHNLVRDMPPDAAIELVHRLLRDGDARSIDVLVGPPLTVLSRCLRSFFKAPAGSAFVGGDFSNIEGRGVAWFSGEEWKIEAFRAADEKRGPGIYELAYSRMFGVPPETVKGETRQVGKVCLAEGTRVLTSSGIRAIQDVTAGDQVWDGTEWVQHAGVVDNGLREVLTLDGAVMTPDHEVLTPDGWRPAQTVAFSARMKSRALALGSASLPLLEKCDCRRADCVSCACSAVAEQRRTRFISTTCSRREAPAAQPARESKSATGAKSSGRTPTSCLMTNTDADCLTAYPRASIGATTRAIADGGTTVDVGSVSQPNGALIDARSCGIWCRCRDGTCRRTNSIASTATADTSPEICVSCRAASTRATVARCTCSSSASSTWKRVYDIAGAGPRRRFTILTDSGALIVHNCELAFGYQGGEGSFHTMGRNYNITVSDAKASELKRAWRAAHPEVVRTWYALERAAIAAVREPGRIFSAGARGREARFRVAGEHLWLLLPSGRALCYPYPKLLPGRFGDQLTYMCVPSQTERITAQIIPDPMNFSGWARVATYGGALMNNVVQGFSRDLLTHVLVEAHAARLSIVLHTHDDANAEVPVERAAQARAQLEQIMRAPPAWASGLPVFAKCHIMTRYGKG